MGEDTDEGGARWVPVEVLVGTGRWPAALDQDTVVSFLLHVLVSWCRGLCQDPAEVS